jgi:hypothetical protein
MHLLVKFIQWLQNTHKKERAFFFMRILEPEPVTAQEVFAIAGAAPGLSNVTFYRCASQGGSLLHFGQNVHSTHRSNSLCRPGSLALASLYCLARLRRLHRSLP